MRHERGDDFGREPRRLSAKELVKFIRDDVQSLVATLVAHPVLNERFDMARINGAVSGYVEWLSVPEDMEQEPEGELLIHHLEVRNMVREVERLIRALPK